KDREATSPEGRARRESAQATVLQQAQLGERAAVEEAAASARANAAKDEADRAVAAKKEHDVARARRASDVEQAIPQTQSELKARAEAEATRLEAAIALPRTRTDPRVAGKVAADAKAAADTAAATAIETARIAGETSDPAVAAKAATDAVAAAEAAL